MKKNKMVLDLRPYSAPNTKNRSLQRNEKGQKELEHLIRKTKSLKRNGRDEKC